MLKNFKKNSPAIFASLIVIGSIVFPQHAAAGGIGNWLMGQLVGGGAEAAMSVFAWLAQVILKFVSWLTYLSGMLLNTVIRFTVVDMASYISKNGAVTGAWKTVRDISNMGFIFVLLYAGIKMILGIGKNVQRLIVTVIVVAILMNFSLFFTKVIIDASNILAMFFYGAMAPDALTSTSSGLADSLLAPLKIQTIWKMPENITADKLFIIGVMGSIVALVAAFVFFAISIMFIIRFVALVFVMILSPLAFMAYILPDLEKYRDQWWGTLMGQAFFAPIYFMLTWIVLKIVEGISLNTGGTWSEAFAGELIQYSDQGFVATGNIELVFTFLVVIALLIATLIISKQYADKSHSLVKSATGWATSTAGGATFGAAGWAGRRTLGRYGENKKDNEEWKARAAQGGVGGAIARAKLNLAKGASTASFDARNARLTESLAKKTSIDLGKLKVKKGEEGFAGVIKQREKRYKDRYGAFKPGKDAKSAAETETKAKEEALEKAREAARIKFDTLMPKSEDHIAAERKLEELRSDSLSALRPEHAEELRAAEETLAKENEGRIRLQTEFVSHKTEEEEKAHKEAEAKSKEMADRMKNLASRMERGLRGGVIDGKRKAKVIRGITKEKSDDETLAEIAAKVAERKAAEKKAAEEAEKEPENK
jgi:hypothetical protein